MRDVKGPISDLELAQVLAHLSLLIKLDQNVEVCLGCLPLSLNSFHRGDWGVVAEDWLPIVHCLQGDMMTNGERRRSGVTGKSKAKDFHVVRVRQDVKDLAGNRRPANSCREARSKFKYIKMK